MERPFLLPAVSFATKWKKKNYPQQTKNAEKWKSVFLSEGVWGGVGGGGKH